MIMDKEKIYKTIEIIVKAVRSLISVVLFLTLENMTYNYF